MVKSVSFFFFFLHASFSLTGGSRATNHVFRFTFTVYIGGSWGLGGGRERRGEERGMKEREKKRKRKKKRRRREEEKRKASVIVTLMGKREKREVRLASVDLLCFSVSFLPLYISLAHFLHLICMVNDEIELCDQKVKEERKGKGNLSVQ